MSPRDDSEGCLQDVHWSEGQFGYFPSYLLGHLISAQFSEAMGIALDSAQSKCEEAIDICIREGNESKLLAWLRKEVHLHGRKMNAEDLVETVTGKPLSSSPFLNYLRKNFFK